LLGLQLTTGVTTDTGAVSGDFEALRRVIRSLIDNAIKYTPEGGRILVSASTNDETVTITVTDTGKGVPETDLPRIFEKFYRGEAEGGAMQPGTAAPGVGLGLYLAQHIVAQLNGEITVESKQGMGTTFSVTLPRWIEDTGVEESEEDADAKALVGS
jgi:signal transduction histidine kinase